MKAYDIELTAPARGSAGERGAGCGPSLSAKDGSAANSSSARGFGIQNTAAVTIIQSGESRSAFGSQLQVN